MATGSVTVIGAGEIGAALALVLADSGRRVELVEPDPARREGLAARLAARHRAMAEAALARGSADAALARLRACADLDQTAPAPDLVIEAGPERAAIKRAILAGALARGPAPVASASSAIPVAELLPDPGAQRRCLNAHPVNPPTIIRLVELAPAPATAPETVDAVARILAGAGFRPVRLGRAVPGFVFNRLQGAVLREAYRLVAEGVIDVAGLDQVVSEALGPRWALSGPFETAELNTPGGIAAHAARMGPAYAAMGRARGETSPDWPEELVAEVARQRRAILPAARIPDRVRWRERALSRLMAARARIMAGRAGEGE